jgi:hypothetical protein
VDLAFRLLLVWLPPVLELAAGIYFCLAEPRWRVVSHRPRLVDPVVREDGRVGLSYYVPPPDRLVGLEPGSVPPRSVVRSLYLTAAVIALVTLLLPVAALVQVRLTHDTWSPAYTTPIPVTGEMGFQLVLCGCPVVTAAVAAGTLFLLMEGLCDRRVGLLLCLHAVADLLLAVLLETTRFADWVIE